MLMTSGSKIEIVFPVTAIFDIKKSEEIMKEIEKEVSDG